MLVLWKLAPQDREFASVEETAMLTLLQPVLAALLGGAGGIAGRLLPEALDYFRKKLDLEQAKVDQAHELAVMDKQIELQKALGRQRLDEIGAAADAGAIAGAVEITRPMGILIVDLLNGLVRPVVTYWYFGLYAACKAVLVAGLLGACKDPQAACGMGRILTAADGGLWTGQDMAVLSGILNFWFLDRVLKHKAESR
jgi:hypothetical protein